MNFNSLIPKISPYLAMFKIPCRSKNLLTCYSIHFSTNIRNLYDSFDTREFRRIANEAFQFKMAYFLIPHMSHFAADDKADIQRERWLAEMREKLRLSLYGYLGHSCGSEA